MTVSDRVQPRYRDPGGNPRKEWIQGFWPNEGDWEGFEERLNSVARGELYSNELFQFMVNDSRSMIENGCNWSAALVLLCFSEACGKLYATDVLGEPDSRPGASFQVFLDHCMQCSDTEALEGELYYDVRSGLAHNFFLLREDHRVSVSMGVDESDPDLSVLASRGYDFIEDTDGRQVWRFACMPYFRLFVHGLDRLVEELERRRQSANDPD